MIHFSLSTTPTEDICVTVYNMFGDVLDVEFFSHEEEASAYIFGYLNK